MYKMKQNVRIGVACLARKTFDHAAAKEIFGNITQKLKSIENVDWEIVPELVIEIEDAQKVAREFASKGIDALICISGTFALGHLILELNKVIGRPILLWGLNELPYDGGKIRLNSVCGINLNASNLYKAGMKTYHVVIGDELDQDWLDAIRILKAFSTARIGLVGGRAHGFFNLDFDESDLKNQLGVTVDRIKLEEIYNQETNEEKVKDRKKQIESIFEISDISADQLDKLSQLVEKFNNFMIKNNLTALAVRCWPEFAANYGISPCAAMSLLQSEGKIITCEGDTFGCLSMLAHAAIGGETPYLADFSQVNFEQDFALLWHCGVAPCNLWDGKCIRSLDTYFAGGKGITADFVMKSGKLSILRIDYAPGEYRVFLQSAEAIPMQKELKGTYAKVKFNKSVKEVLDKIIYTGVAHHVSVVYGDFMRPLEIFAKIKGLKIIK
jgi:L-fucose isomerase-like protein